MLRRLFGGREEDVDERKEEKEVEPPLRAGFKGAKTGSVKMNKRGSCSPNQNSNFHPTLQRTHRFVPLKEIRSLTKHI
jgi:hypothetical protein